MKTCKRCCVEKPVEEFCKRSSRSGGLASCLECERKRKYEYAKEYRAKNQERIRERDRIYRKRYPDRVRRMNLKKTYDMTPEQYASMLSEQNNKCFLCDFSHRTNGKREEQLHIDHCHVTGKIRGLLCTQCNKGLGCFKDRIDVLQKAVQYLQR